MMIRFIILLCFSMVSTSHVGANMLPDNQGGIIATKAEAHPDFDEEIVYSDALEPYNRVMYHVNEHINGLLLRPFASLYRDAMPTFIQKGVSNVLDHIWSPVSVVNSALQGRFDKALDTVTRIFINTIFGFFGLMDVASDIGFEKHQEDFGQTLAVWGVSPGPYLVLPLIGPSNFRDTIGRVGDYFMDPVNIYATRRDKKGLLYTRWGVSSISRLSAHLETIDSLKEASVDFYATLKSVYEQHRADQIDEDNSQKNNIMGPEAFLDLEEEAFAHD